MKAITRRVNSFIQPKIEPKPDPKLQGHGLEILTCKPTGENDPAQKRVKPDYNPNPTI